LSFQTPPKKTFDADPTDERDDPCEYETDCEKAKIWIRL